MIDPLAWRLDYDEEGKLVAVPVENPPVVQGGELPYRSNILPFIDFGEDPEHERAKIAGLAHS